jgi:hypothetical protein
MTSQNAALIGWKPLSSEPRIASAPGLTRRAVHAAPLCYNTATMPARDIYHDAIRNALIKDGWTITDDPLHLQYGEDDLFVDLAAEQIVGAERGGKRIAVEIKTFAGPSPMTDLHSAVGQFTVYRIVLARVQPDRELYLAVSEAAFEEVFGDSVGALMLEQQITRVLAFDPAREVIVKWIPEIMGRESVTERR